jgi:SAM-dependent methyltransferase
MLDAPGKAGSLHLAVMPGDSGLAKAQAVVAAFPAIWQGRSVIDVGSRGRELERALSGVTASYTGVDLDPAAEVVADLGEHLPFADDFADVVVALDVLEHTDDIHHSFAELCRVASEHIVIALPNVYVIECRLSVMRGEWLSKYGLPIDKPADRHRWFFSLDMARSWTVEQAKRCGWHVIEERALVGPRRARAAGWAAQRWPNLLAQTYLALLEPR